MRIVEFTAFHLRIRLRKTVRHAAHTRRENDTLVVRCRLNDGSEGWGEGLPRPYVTGETIETAWQQLQSTDLKRQWGMPLPDGLNSAIEACREFQPAQSTEAVRDCFGNSLRCAVELSVLDAMARSEGVPLSDVTGRIPETKAIRKDSDTVRYSAVMTPAGPVRELIRAWKYRHYNFHQIKVKVGVSGVKDIGILKRVRRMVGPEFDLRLDANEAWSCDNLIRKLEPLLAFHVTSLEQPVPHAEVDGLAGIRRQISTPIMLDESLCSLSDAERAIEGETCDLFNIRLSKCGGFLNALRLASIAEDAGLGYQLGCQVGETGILSAAGRHFASSVGGILYLEGSYDRYLVREPLTVEDLTFQRGGFAPAITQPGLGITINTDAVRRTTIAEQHFPIC